MTSSSYNKGRFECCLHTMKTERKQDCADLFMPAEGQLQAKFITVAIVEEDARVRGKLANILKRDRAVYCVGQCASAEEALEKIPLLRPKVVLVNINLPGMQARECVRHLGGLLPEAQIVMFAVCVDSDAVFHSLSAGALMCLLKPVSWEMLLGAVMGAPAGGGSTTSSNVCQVLHTFKQTALVSRVQHGLAPREQEVLECLVQGYLYKEIAERINVSYKTVDKHIERLFRKLHVHSRTQAVTKYLSK